MYNCTCTTYLITMHGHYILEYPSGLLNFLCCVHSFPLMIQSKNCKYNRTKLSNQVVYPRDKKYQHQLLSDACSLHTEVTHMIYTVVLQNVVDVSSFNQHCDVPLLRFWNQQQYFFCFSRTSIVLKSKKCTPAYSFTFFFQGE